MKHKTLLLGLTTVATIATATLAIGFSHNDTLKVRANDDGMYTFEHIFDTSIPGHNATASLNGPAAVSYGVGYEFTLTGKTALGTDNLTSYPFVADESYPEGCFINDYDGDGINVSITDGMVTATTLTNGKYCSFQVMYTFFDGVVFDETSSFVTYKFYKVDQGVSYLTAYFKHWEDNKYYATFDNGSHMVGNDYISIQKVHFEYYCE